MHQYSFRWIAWNLEKIDKHDAGPDEIEYVVCHATPPFPRIVGDAKRLVWGRTPVGEYLQVVYVLEPNGVVFVIHARPLTDREKKRFRRRRR